MELYQAIQKRKSVRKFSNKIPNWKEIIEALNSCKYTPMAGNNFSLKFILIKDKEKIIKLAEASQQQFLATAPYVVAFCSNPTPVIRNFGNRGYDYLRQQAGAAIQTFLLSLTEKGLSSCWVGHFVNSQVKKILSISNPVEVEALIAVGYEHTQKTHRKEKIELDDILFFDEFKNKKMQKGETFNA